MPRAITGGIQGFTPRRTSDIRERKEFDTEEAAKANPTNPVAEYWLEVERRRKEKEKRWHEEEKQKYADTAKKIADREKAEKSAGERRVKRAEFVAAETLRESIFEELQLSRSERSEVMQRLLEKVAITNLDMARTFAQEIILRRK